MADPKTEPREPDAVEEASSADAGNSAEASALESTADVPLPDFEEMNNRIKETRKPAGPEIEDPEPGTGALEAADEEDIGPTDPS